MKICLVAPGFLPIPSNGWGAVENIIWDYKYYLEKNKHEVIIVNDSDKNNTLKLINESNSDICHCHYDGYIDVLKKCNVKTKIITTHYGMIRRCVENCNNSFEKYALNEMFPLFNDENIHVFVLDEFIKVFFTSKFSINEKNMFIVKNGARDDLIEFSEMPNTNRSICIGKIDYRKRQNLLKDLDVYLVGKVDESSIDINYSKLLGEWTRNEIYTNLTHNVNLVLLSYSEAAPLVTVESLMAGLGLVISEACTANLDLSLPFIDVISESKMYDQEYIRNIIDNNKIKSLKMRKEIREYAISNFSLTNIVEEYIQKLHCLLNSKL